MIKTIKVNGICDAQGVGARAGAEMHAEPMVNEMNMMDCKGNACMWAHKGQVASEMQQCHDEYNSKSKLSAPAREARCGILGWFFYCF